MTEANWIAKSIIPKSDQLNAEDLLSGPVTVTVIDVQKGSADQPIAILIDGGRQAFRPCKTMRKMLVYCWGDQAANWIGKRMTLYADPSVKWAGIEVGGIRISHIDGIDKATTLMLSETRGKRKPYSVMPFADGHELPVFKHETGTALWFADWVETAKTSNDLDKIAKAVVKSQLTTDEVESLKTKVTEARALLKTATK